MCVRMCISPNALKTTRLWMCSFSLLAEPRLRGDFEPCQRAVNPALPLEQSGMSPLGIGSVSQAPWSPQKAASSVSKGRQRACVHCRMTAPKCPCAGQASTGVWPEGPCGHRRQQDTPTGGTAFCTKCRFPLWGAARCPMSMLPSSVGKALLCSGPGSTEPLSPISKQCWEGLHLGSYVSCHAKQPFADDWAPWVPAVPPQCEI